MKQKTKKTVKKTAVGKKVIVPVFQPHENRLTFTRPERNLVLAFARQAIRLRCTAILHTIVIWSPRSEEDCASEILKHALDLMRSSENHQILEDRIKSSTNLRDEACKIIACNWDVIFKLA